MKNRIFYLTGIAVIMVLSFSTRYCGAQVRWIQSSPAGIWIPGTVELTNLKDIPVDATVFPEKQLQVVDGFGACFNELGWTALSVLNAPARESIIKNLFDPADGLKLNICRMPIGANDYALDYYSLNDSAGDFEMKYFSIARDQKMLIPYIKEAMKYRPDLRIWGSPWCPPAWMKTNQHYACRPDVNNGMTPDQAGREGITLFRMEPAYLRAYALYFSKYLQAYRNEGIRLTGVHVQNEMNSCQNFPSCIWTATDLGTFIGKYLGPELEASVPDAEIWYGTVERPSVEKIDTILQSPSIERFISGISFQWAGKQAIPGVHRKYPGLKLMQSETECGNGSNDWKAAEYTFSLMKHYFDNGVSIYTFWNSVLDETGKSMWGWKQNSMITVNSKTREITYNPEFYLLKHFSCYIQPGARMLSTSGRNEGLLAFLNPDSSLVVIAGNTKDEVQKMNLKVGDHILAMVLLPHSFNSFLMPGLVGDRDLAPYCGPEDYKAMVKIDAHCHINTDRPAFLKTAVQDNFRIITINTDAPGNQPIQEQERFAIHQLQAFPGQVAYLATFSMKGWDDAGWADKTIAMLETSLKKGAVGVKIWKNIGMVEKDKDGKFIMIDDPKFDPVFDFLEKKGIPVCGHLGEPRNCWLPLESMTVNGDRTYFQEHPEYHMYIHPEYPSYDDQIRARDNLLRKHPGLIFVGAHLGSLEWSVDELAKRFDEFPNMSVDMAARICHIQRQTQDDWAKVRDFIIKYQDRLLYGTDWGDDGLADPAELNEGMHRVWSSDWRFFTTDDIMTTGDFRGEFRGLRLPREVVEKIFYRNASTRFPGLR
jgi:glucosylceramidase